MKSALVILTLLGCDCDGISCEYIRTVSSDWTSIENCQSSTDFQRATKEKASYPLLVAHCSVDGGEAAASGLMAEDGTGAPDGRRPDIENTKSASDETRWGISGDVVRDLIVSGVSYPVRAIGSGFKSYVGDPARWVSSRVFAGPGD